MTRLVCASILLLLSAFAIFTEEPLTTDTILRLVKAGLGEEVIVGMINSQPGKYSLGADSVLALKTAGASDKVLAAMIKKGEATPTNQAETAPEPKHSIGLPDELGLYHLKDGKYIALVPEILNLRTARFGAILTGGIKVAKLNGWVVNPHSPNRVGPQTEMVIRLPEGTDPAEYICLQFDVKGNRREVEVARGRINVSASTHRAAIPFKAERLEKGIYKLTFGGFKPGEYGLLPPSNLDASAASAGKIYTFMVES